MLVQCADVPASALADRPGATGTISDVSFAFRPSDRRLVNVTITSWGLAPEEASSRAIAAASRLGRALGAPHRSEGEPSAARLARGGYATATIQYRHADYLAEITACGFGERGVAVREHYLSGRD